MKAFVLMALMTFSFSSLANLDISNPRIEVKYGGGLAAVQPTAHLSFEFASCSKFNLKLLKKTDRATLVVKLLVQSAPNQMDCMGPRIHRTYSLQISSDYSGQRYSVLNVLAPNIK